MKRLPTPEHDGLKSYYMPRQRDQECEVAGLAVAAQDTLDPLPEPIVRLAAQRLRQIGGMPDAVAKRALGADGVMCVEGGSGVADALRAVFELEGGGAEVTVVEQGHTLPFTVIAEALTAREEAQSRLILVAPMFRSPLVGRVDSTRSRKRWGCRSASLRRDCCSRRGVWWSAVTPSRRPRSAYSKPR